MSDIRSSASEEGSRSEEAVRLDDLLDQHLFGLPDQDSTQLMLNIALGAGATRAARALCDAGVLAGLSQGVAALQRATAFGRVQLVEDLVLEYGVDVNGYNDGVYPLHIALQAQNFTLVETLVRLGADVTAKNFRQETPMHWAIYYGSPNAVELFKERGADIDAEDNNRLRPLHWAIDTERFTIAAMLLAWGADPCCKTVEGVTPLHFTAYRNSHIARLVIEAGADVNALVNQTQQAALHVACNTCDVNFVRLLLEHGARVDLGDDVENYPMHYAAQNREHGPAMIVLLKEFGAQVDSVDQEGGTPLHDAVTLGLVDCAAALLEAGADPYLRNKESKSPLDLAQAAEDRDLRSAFEHYLKR
eukprot:CAMPEP_0184523272 /NCGR_PEP_ID=MMETSP0198_2-20121128/8786_1 /TAXON_ID=1112570 /ORGANISM="Thraustochytrium sp., Strain LLF1b" /LENGTH=360 /DNA_ID=CAMNT_0026914273 /DNA_START=1977 /DNA_END=3059 /DNA_ORIENTATION=-